MAAESADELVVLALGIREQIRQYQEKVDVSAQSFSVSELVAALHEISEIKRLTIRSVGELQTFVESMQENIDIYGDYAAKIERLIMYSRWFLDNFAYLKELKIYFDTRIYLPMSRIFSSDSEVMTDGERLRSIRSYKDDTSADSDSDLEKVTGRLKYLHNCLEHLLEDEGVVSPALFSDTSSRSVAGLTLTNHDFVRLIPDILLKLGRAASLAECWLEIVTSNDYDGGRKLTHLERVKVLTNRLATVNGAIKDAEDRLTTESSELEELLVREDRSTNILDKSQLLDARLNKLHNQLNITSHQITDINDLVKTAMSNDKFTRKLRTDLKKKQHMHDDLVYKARLLEFEQKLITEDLCFELEVKPSLIRFTSSLQDNCQLLEASLETKRAEKEKLEMALKPVVSE